MPDLFDAQRREAAAATEARRGSRSIPRSDEPPAPPFILTERGCGNCTGWGRSSDVLGRCRRGRFEGTLTSFAALCPDHNGVT